MPQTHLDLPSSDTKQLPLSVLGLKDCTPHENASDRFFYATPLFSQKLALLQNLAGHSDFVVVMGEQGSGKTTILHRLMTEDPDGWQAGRVRLKASNTNPAKALLGLNNRLVYFSKKPGALSLMIDDAHQLTRTELKTIIRKALSEEAAFKFKCIVLFAEPSIRTELGTISTWLPDTTVMDKIDISPLNEEQTSEYLHRRFDGAGILHQHPFDAAQLRAIYQSSGGLPGMINHQAYIALKAMYAEKDQETESSLKLKLSETLWKVQQWCRRPLLAEN
jgi:MSHA biogenesis protein MshM